MKKHIIILIIGIVVFGMGIYQNTQYEENSLMVTATITDIKTVDETDEGPISYEHTYYGEYTVDGEEYSNKKLKTSHTSSITPDFNEGDTIDIRVQIDDPSKKVAEGGLFIVGGFTVTIYSIVVLIKNRKQLKIRQS